MPKHAYTVHITSECTDRSVDYENAYGGWQETWEQSFEGVEVGGIYPDIVSDLEVLPGQRCFVLWSTWTEADSFGYATHRGVEPLAIFLDREAAEDVQSTLNHLQTGAYDIEALDGQRLQGIPPWRGYYDHLEDLNISEAVMELGTPSVSGPGA